MAFIGTPQTVFNQNTDNDGNLIGSEISRLYDNDNALKSISDILIKGYKNGRFETSGATLTIYGVYEVFNQFVNFLSGSALSFAGATTGNHYVYIEWNSLLNIAELKRVAIAPTYIAEITADTNKYSPSPTFNNVQNSYLLNADPKKIIIGFVFYDSGFKTVHAYKSGINKNDDFWQSVANPTIVTENAINSRLQYTDDFRKSFGSNIDIVDNGAGLTNSNGLRITVNRRGRLKLRVSIYTQTDASGGKIIVACEKNNTQIVTDISLEDNGQSFLNQNFIFNEIVEPNDFFVFYISTSTTLNVFASIRSITAIFDEV